MRALVVLVTLAGCVAPRSTFVCETTDDCTVGGVCETTGFCSFDDGACDSGRRYGEASGELADTCVPASPIDAPPVCGDGKVGAGEECDDGDEDTTDACVACKRARCGDGVVRKDVEECDDGNQVDGDSCNANCLVCGEGAVVNPANQHCYTLVSPTATWSIAAVDCVASGGHLASIGSADENAFVAALLSGGDAWVGLEDYYEGHYYWQDDEPLAFTSWGTGEPSTDSGDNCTSITKQSGRWSHRGCGALLPYVCERAPSTVSPTGHAYRQFSGVAQQAYPAARETCRAMGAHLATLTSADEHAFVDAISGATKQWIGLEDIAVEGTYRWDGGEPVDFTNWGLLQPSGLIQTNEDCVVLDEGTWADRNCTSDSAIAGFFCEIDP